MANHYWVGGSGNWSDTAHWSLTSGGASGASVPTSADIVFVNTGAPTITIDVAASCLDMVWSGATGGSLVGSQTLSIWGGVTLVSAMTTISCPINFASTGTLRALTLAGKTLSGVVSFTGTGSWLLQAATTFGVVNLTAGTLDLKGFAVTMASFNAVSASTKKLTMGGSPVTVTGSAGWVGHTTLTIQTPGNITFSFTGGNQTFTPGGATYGVITASPTTSIMTTDTYSNTFTLSEIVLNNFSKFQALPGVTINVTNTITSLIAASGANASLKCSALGPPIFVNCSSSPILQYVTFQGVDASGGQKIIAATGCVDSGTNVNVFFGWAHKVMTLIPAKVMGLFVSQVNQI